MARRPEREHQLIATLEAGTRPLSGADLGRLLGVSAHSVRDYVRAINRRAGRTVIEASHQGYVLDQEAYARLNESALVPGEGVGPSQRALNLLELLLFAGDSGDVHELCDLLHVSLPTLELELGRSRKILRDHGLQLVRHRDRVSIEGEEAQKRLLLRHAVWSAATGSRREDFAELVVARPAYPLGPLRSLVSHELDEHRLETNEFALNDLAVNLVVAVARARAGRHLPAAELSTLPEVVEALADEVGERLDVRLDLAERQHLADLVEANSRPVAAEPSDIVPADVREAVERALSEVAAEFQMVRAGQEMVDKLVLHVNALRRRARTGAFVHNPLSRPFKETQPLLHELAVQFARKLGASLSIAVGESEVGFLAFYLAHHFQLTRESDSQVTVQFVVPRYAPLLAGFHSAVERAVGDHGFVGPPLTAEEVRAEAIDGDVVVTCVHLSPIPGVRTVRVSPVPTTADLSAITEAVLAVAAQRRRTHVWSVLSDLIRPEHYFSDTAWTDRDQVITALAQVLIDGGYAPDWFTADVLERERLSSTAFRDQFAIPHGLQLSAHRTGIAVFVSQRPVVWGDSSVQLVMLFAFEPEERRIFRDVFDTLIGFLSSPQATASLIAAGGTHQEFMARLAELMHDAGR